MVSNTVIAEPWPSDRAGLLQTAMNQYVTDGGIETDLIFHHGVDGPEFAIFPLVEDEHGRELLTRYYDGYAEIAAKAGVGLTLDAPTWRANPDWAAKLGYDAAALDRVNRAAIEFMQGLRESYGSSYGLTTSRSAACTARAATATWPARTPTPTRRRTTTRPRSARRPRPEPTRSPC